MKYATPENIAKIQTLIEEARRELLALRFVGTDLAKIRYITDSLTNSLSILNDFVENDSHKESFGTVNTSPTMS